MARNYGLTPDERVWLADLIDTLEPGEVNDRLWIVPDPSLPGWLHGRPRDAHDVAGLLLRVPNLTQFGVPEVQLAFIVRQVGSGDAILQAYDDLVEFSRRHRMEYPKVLREDPHRLARALRGEDRTETPDLLAGLEIPDYARS